MNENTALKTLLAPDAALILVGIDYAHDLVGAPPRQAAEKAIPRDAIFVATGIGLASRTAIAGY